MSRYFTLATLKKTVVSLLGIPLLILGIALLILPGPGILVLILALTLLAQEYNWAKSPLDNAKNYLKNTRKEYKVYETRLKEASNELRVSIKENLKEGKSNKK